MKAAEETNVDTTHESFDSTVVTVPQDDIGTFLEHLQLNL
jgi:hypothetical protein